MQSPRFSISHLMALVMIAALACGGVRLLFPLSRPRSELILLGAIPMAVILGVGLVLLWTLTRRPGPSPGRPYLIGFEIAGAIALLFFICAVFYHAPSIDGLARAALRLLSIPFRPGHPGTLAAGVAILVSPQMAVALVGGLLGGRLAGRYKVEFKVTIAVERRHVGVAAPAGKVT